MPSICIYFQVHQPLRIKKYKIFDVGNDHNYFNDQSESNLNNNRILAKVAEKSYLPTNKLILKLLKKHPQLKICYSFSGVLLKQLEESQKKVLDSFKKLADSGQVEILSETYYHSLAFFYSREEFESQVKLHRQKIKSTFGILPQIFRNTELAYSNELARWAEAAG